MSENRPWTAIIGLNEEYYIACEERYQLSSIKDSRILQKLPITRLISRKFVFPSSAQPLPESRPWENWTVREAKSLHINYNADNPDHGAFNLQEQSIRDIERGLHMVFFDYFELQMDIFKEKQPYRIGFQQRKIPQGSETLRLVQGRITYYRERLGLYNNPSKQAQQLYARIFKRPSCLEICSIESGLPTNPIRPKDVTDEYLEGRSDQAQDFMYELEKQTRMVIGVYYKRFDETAKGWILDGKVEF